MELVILFDLVSLNDIKDFLRLKKLNLETLKKGLHLF